MRRALAAVLIATTLLAGHAIAYAQPAPSETDVSRSMESGYIAVPVVREGRLVNYLFVSLRIDVSPSVDLWATRERAHFLRDALVRAAHRTSLADPARDDRLNERVALAAFRAAAQEALGPRAVRAISIHGIHSSRPVRVVSR